MQSKTIFVQTFPTYGYEIRTEEVQSPDNADPQIMRNAYTNAGDYIGDRPFAELLCEVYSIAPEKISPKQDICQIGFCEKEQKWYGWSHKAIEGYGIGSSAERLHTPIVADTAEDDDDKHPQRHERSMYPADLVQETWTAKTLDDAKQMAIDFAESVS